MKNQKKILILVSIILLGVGVIYLLNSSNNTIGSDSKGSMRIDLPNWIGCAPLYLAREKGFFKEEGVDVELGVTEGTGEQKAILKTGRADAQVITVDMLVWYAHQGVPSIAVLEIDRSVGGDGIVATADVRDVKDLKGKTIALQEGMPSHFFFLYLLEQENLTSKDVKILNMETATAGASFVAGKVDAAVIWEPWLSKASERTGGYVLVSTKEEPDVIVDILVFRPEVIRDRTEDVKAVMRAWFRAVEYCKTHREESNRIMAKAYSLTVEEFEAMISGLEWADYPSNTRYFGTKENPGRIYDVAFTAEKILVEGELIQSKVSLVDVIDSSLLEEFKYPENHS